MKDDPVVDEARCAGEAYLAQFNFNLEAACADLQRRTEEAARAGQKVISLPPRPPLGQHVPPSKKAG